MSTRPVVHLFCNAHIDPVWLWTWEEGLREAISTFTTAANLLDEFPEFVFNHNESVLYEWVEEYDPVLFERIRGHVASGRWNITGGWYLQPDVNLPGGETLVRVILEGRRYFAEKFGVRPSVSYNFDTFGHPGSLPQLLSGADFKMYIHYRPDTRFLDLPGMYYRWRSADGSEVFAVRPDAWYCTPWPGSPERETRRGVERARQTGRDVLVMWGLGDHGGGPTRAELLNFRKLLAEFKDADVEIRHSTPEAFYAAHQPYLHEYPVYQGELQRTLSGTYTSVAPIKRQMREGEALLASAERWAAAAWWRFGRPYPADQLREAWKRHLFNSFHDTLCGSLSEEAIGGVDDMFGFAHDVARRVIVKGQHALMPHVAPTPETIPVYVGNPHGTPIRTAVGLNFLSDYAPPPAYKEYALYDDQGALVTSQNRGGDAIILDENAWKPFCGFIADVPPLSIRRYEIRFQPAPTFERRIAVQETDQAISVTTPFWTATFDRACGLVSLIHKASGKDLLNGAVRFVAMKDRPNAWGSDFSAVFNEPFAPLEILSPAEVGAFVGAESREGPGVRVITNGDVWVTVEWLSGWAHTRASLRFTLYADLPHIDLNTTLYMGARAKMLKLQFPFTAWNCRPSAEIPHGVAQYPADASEYPFSRWVRLDSHHLNVGIANNGLNGFDVNADGKLNLSVARGAIHGSPLETDADPNKSYTFMDQEQINTKFRIVAGEDRAETAGALVAAAQELNHPLEKFFAYFAPTPSTGAVANPAPLLQVSPSSVVLGALKKAETEDALVIRLQETAGTSVTATIELDGAAPFIAEFTPYQIRTFKIAKGSTWQACNLLEEVR
ncbi:MAG: hypothetical protein J0M07_02285 [Anaerolineae bacterium]|nr:hypothetical protein [Anaerolineae bacterium]